MAIKEKTKEVGVELNEQNTNCMLLTSKEKSVHDLVNVTIGSYNFNVVKELTTSE